LALSWLLACWSEWDAQRRFLLVAIFLFLLAGLLIGASRGAVGAMATIPLVLGLAWRKRNKWVLPVLLLALIIGGASLTISRASVTEKHFDMAGRADITNGRISIWRRALIAWEIYPWFGVGINNFSAITDEIVRKRIQEKGGIYRREAYVGANHAHSLYLNTLAERGIIGGGVFVAVFIGWLSTLLRNAPPVNGPNSNLEWALWGGSLASWFIVVLSGLANTSFHHEIALLALLLLGGWLAFNKPSVDTREPGA
jgi:O-antigen ligase